MMSAIPDLACVFCKEVFEDKESLQIHFRKHADPNFNTKVKNRLQNDAETPSEKTKEEVEMVECDACSEVFPTISKAITHKHKVHPDLDAKYFCPSCGKLFTLKHLYNKHLQSHGNIEENGSKDFHCDSCDVDFNVAAAMLHHNKFFHRQDTMLPEIGHSRKQKLFNQDLLPVYYCTFCGEEYNNKVNLHKHMHDDHSDENQSPDEVMRCPLCDAVFYHLDAYECHLTYHSSDDVYSERNEIHESEISEYTLETVSPIMEKVESLEDNNAADLEKFLQIAMDSDSTNTDQFEKKSKKHKKHKKSKKSITLDEFLSMNTDVFGEGIDVQGIEEVPTQVVAKQLKTKRPAQAKTGLKMLSTTDLEKLKKQGIIVKSKPGKNTTPMQGLKVGSKIHSHLGIGDAKSTFMPSMKPESQKNAISTSSEVLSKLISQSNNQIRIVKKSPQELVDPADNEVKPNPIDQIEQSIANTITTEEAMPAKSIDNTDNTTEDESQKETDGFNDCDERSKNDDLKNDPIDESPGNKDLTNTASGTLIKDVASVTEAVHDSDEFREILEKNSAHSPRDGMDVIPEVNSETSNDSEKCIKAFHNCSIPANTDKLSLSPVDHLKNITVKSLKSSTSNNSRNEKQSLVQVESEKHSDTIANVVDEETCKNQSEKTNNLVASNETVNLQNKLAKKPLDALKHLGNLTIKSVNQPRSPVNDNIGANQSQNATDDSQSDAEMEEVINEICETSSKQLNNSVKLINPKDQTSVNALKNLSKLITVKPVIQPPKIMTEEYTDDENDEENPNFSNSILKSTDSQCYNLGKQNKIVNTNMSPVQDLPLKNSPIKVNSNINIQSKGYSSPTNKELVLYNNETPMDESSIKSQHTDILKHLKNVTAKPLTVMKNSNQSTVKSSMQSVNMMKKQIIQQCTKTEEVNKAVEIFNVDDSDSDREETLFKNAAPSNTVNNMKMVETLKKLNQNITMKSANQQMNKNIERQTITSNTKKDGFQCMKSESFSKSIEKSTISSANAGNNTILQNALKNLGSNITIKSKNASPNVYIKSPQQNTQDSMQNENMDDVDSDSDYTPGKVKITEITADNMSDDEFPEDQSKNNNIKRQYNVNQSPTTHHQPFSDDDDFDDIDHSASFTDEVTDAESKIKSNTNKTHQNNQPESSYKESLKNIGKNITIKSINDRKNDNGYDYKTSNEICEDTPELPDSLGKELTIKPFKQAKTVHQNVVKGFSSSDSTNHTAPNQKVSIPGNEVNTINKEVTVKTYQTETVIEEITTTVTKTIRTVNSTKQEVQNKNQISTAPVKVQKFTQNVRPNLQFRNPQGMAVRQTLPTGQPRMRNAMTPVRPVVPAIRPSNQLVPVRPGVNLTRPRMQAANRMVSPQSSQPKPVIGKPLKISPNVMNASMKRPMSNQACGPVKKSKEFTALESDMSIPSKCTVNYASTSHTSNSSFVSKTVKGNSVVSTQMKSEMSSSTQQCFTKLNNVTGLKIVKSNQAKQVTKMEEKCDGASKRTLDAIEMLQKQGLLVKKPRLEFNNDSEHSNSGEEDTNDYTVEEFDD